jgi:hypothetical protein
MSNRVYVKADLRPVKEDNRLAIKKENRAAMRAAGKLDLRNYYLSEGYSIYKLLFDNILPHLNIRESISFDYIKNLIFNEGYGWYNCDDEIGLWLRTCMNFEILSKSSPSTYLVNELNDGNFSKYLAEAKKDIIAKVKEEKIRAKEEKIKAKDLNKAKFDFIDYLAGNDNIYKVLFGDILPNMDLNKEYDLNYVRNLLNDISDYEAESDIKNFLTLCTESGILKDCGTGSFIKPDNWSDNYHILKVSVNDDVVKQKEKLVRKNRNCVIAARRAASGYCANRSDVVIPLFDDFLPKHKIGDVFTKKIAICAVKDILAAREISMKDNSISWRAGGWLSAGSYFGIFKRVKAGNYVLQPNWIERLDFFMKKFKSTGDIL